MADDNLSPPPSPIPPHLQVTFEEQAGSIPGSSPATAAALSTHSRAETNPVVYRRGPVHRTIVKPPKPPHQQRVLTVQPPDNANIVAASSHIPIRPTPRYPAARLPALPALPAGLQPNEPYPFTALQLRPHFRLHRGIFRQVYPCPQCHRLPCECPPPTHH
jgi:hypothetical protein